MTSGVTKKKNKPYSLPELVQLEKMFRENRSDSEIALALGRTISGILTKRSELGLLQSKPDYLKEAKEIAALRGGKCLSEKYISNTKHLQWRCNEGHEWYAILISVRRGSWCNECRTGVGERIVRVYLEEVFKTKFPKIRPDWLRNPRTGANLELDGYSETLKIAFEHHGVQHYKKTSEFVTTPEQLKWQKTKDRFKKKICKAKGVVLIEIPSIPDLLPLDQLPQLLQSIFDKLKLKATFPSIANVDIGRAFLGDSKEQLKEIMALAQAKGGKLVSTQFMGWTRKHDFICEAGHQFPAVPNRLKHEDKWCARCAGVKLKTFEEVVAEIEPIVKKHGGKIISTTYLNGKTPMDFECAIGHSFSTLVINVRKGHWCEQCYKLRQGDKVRQRTFDRAKLIITKKGGTLLTKNYSFSREKLKIQCKHLSHKPFEMDPILLNQSHWCPRCGVELNAAAFSMRFSEVEELIRNNFGTIISAEGYKNSQSRIHVKCQYEHPSFFITGRQLKAGSWCKKCGIARSATSRTQNIEVFIKIAEDRGGKCLSSVYQPNELLIWQCHVPHKPWSATGASVKGGSWCPECAKVTMGAYKKLDLDAVKQDAVKLGGRFLENEYRGSFEKHKYECKNGHKFSATPSGVRGGSWCPDCQPNRKRTLEEVQQFAKKHGLELLSDTYQNAKTLYKWKCEKCKSIFERTYDKIKQLPKCRKC